MEVTDEEMRQFFHFDPVPLPSSPPATDPSAADKRCNASTSLDVGLEIPSYLSSIDETNFVKLIEHNGPYLDRPVNREDVRYAAILTHHLTMLELERSLWESYLKCGIRPVEPTSERLPCWATRVITMVTERMSDDDCLRLVQQQVSDLDKEEQVLRKQWNEKTKQIVDYKRMWESPIRALVMEQTESFRQSVLFKIRVVEFDYGAHRLEDEFEQENPSTAQMQQATRLLDLKYQYEHARQEVLLFKEQIVQNKLPPLFDALQEPAPHSFRALFDTRRGQQLSDRQQAILQDYRKEMIDLHLDILEAKRDESHTVFNGAMHRMRERQDTVPLADRFSPAMIHILDRQLALMTERLECTYQFQIQQFTVHA